MFVEAQEGAGAIGILPIFVALVCAGGFFWFAWFKKQILIALGIALIGAGALMAPALIDARSAATNRPFDVIVADDMVSETGFVQKMAARGGLYNGPTGHRVRLERKPDWPGSATLVINDTGRLLTVREFHYSNLSTVPGGQPLIQVVFPGDQAVVEGLIHATLDEGTPPPATIKSTQAVDVIYVLYRSKEPYDPALHGSREALLSQRALMQ